MYPLSDYSLHLVILGGPSSRTHAKQGLLVKSPASRLWWTAGKKTRWNQYFVVLIVFGPRGSEFVMIKLKNGAQPLQTRLRTTIRRIYAKRPSPNVARSARMTTAKGLCRREAYAAKHVELGVVHGDIACRGWVGYTHICSSIRNAGNLIQFKLAALKRSHLIPEPYRHPS